MSKKSKEQAATPLTTSPSEVSAEKTVFKISDDLIGMVRELVQLSLLTGTNIVDHLRAVVVEVSASDKRYVTVSPEYVDAYNEMIEKLNVEAEAKMQEMQNTLAQEITVDTEDSSGGSSN